MRISEILQSIATWLESPDNEALLLAEYNDDCLKIVAENCVLAAALLKNAAEQVDTIEPPEESHLTPQAVEELAQIANAFDQSGDERLMKQASVIDELLLTIAAPPNEYISRKDLQENRIEDLKDRYDNNSKLKEMNNMANLESQIDKSNMYKELRPLEHALQTRVCPDHPGAQLARVGQDMFQCEIDKKVYDYANGYTLDNGNKVPGTSVEKQTTSVDMPTYSMYDTRQGRLGFNN